MRALTDEAAYDWCSGQGVYRSGARLRFADGPSTALVVPLPEEPSRLPWFGLYLFDFDVDRPTDCLLWVREWTVATDLMIDVGVGHFNRLRASYGVGETVEERRRCYSTQLRSMRSLPSPCSRCYSVGTHT